MTTGSGGRRGANIFLALVLLATTVAGYTLVLSRLWALTSADSDFVAAERNGVVYLRPLSHLMHSLTKARSDALRSGDVDTAGLRSAITAVDQLDVRLGGALGTTQRWTELRGRADELLAAKSTGKKAFDQYGDLTTLALELMTKVGDSSKLILDPELSSYYLMDAAMIRLPRVMVETARIADEAELAGPAAKGDTRIQAAIRITSARYLAAIAADAVGTDIDKAMDTADHNGLSRDMAAALDAFRAVMDRVTPPSSLLPTAGGFDSAGLAATAQKVGVAALTLGDAVLTELDALLKVRGAQLSDERNLALVGVGVGIAVVLLLLWWAVPAVGRQGRHGSEDRDPADLPDIARFATDLPQINPRDLLAAEELQHVGRGVRAPVRERDDDAG